MRMWISPWEERKAKSGERKRRHPGIEAVAAATKLREGRRCAGCVRIFAPIATVAWIATYAAGGGGGAQVILALLRTLVSIHAW